MNNETTLPTGSTVSLSAPDDQTLPRGSRLTLKTIRDLAAQIQYELDPRYMCEKAEEIEQLTSELLAQYEQQIARQ